MNNDTTSAQQNECDIEFKATVFSSPGIDAIANELLKHYRTFSKDLMKNNKYAKGDESND